MRLSIDIPDELHRKAKVKAAQEGTTLAEVVRSLLTNWSIGSWKEAKEYHQAITVVDKTVHVPPPPASPRPQPDPPPFVRPISKEDQAKGRSRK